MPERKTYELGIGDALPQEVFGREGPKVEYAGKPSPEVFSMVVTKTVFALIVGAKCAYNLYYPTNMKSFKLEGKELNVDSVEADKIILQYIMQ